MVSGKGCWISLGIQRMSEQLVQYITMLYRAVPSGVYLSLFFLFCLVGVIIIAIYGINRGWRKIVRLVLVEYVFFIYCSTVFFRTYFEERGYNYNFFWSYKAIREGREELFAENIMNVVVFVPIGILLCYAFRYIKWWQILLVGGLISVSIEAMQYGFNRGFAETDDVMHNTFGYILGYGVFLMIQGLWRKVHSNKRFEG